MLRPTVAPLAMRDREVIYPYLPTTPAQGVIGGGTLHTASLVTMRGGRFSHSAPLTGRGLEMAQEEIMLKENGLVESSHDGLVAFSVSSCQSWKSGWCWMGPSFCNDDLGPHFPLTVPEPGCTRTNNNGVALYISNERTDPEPWTVPELLLATKYSSSNYLSNQRATSDKALE
jgi:hypothetical protein